MVDNQTWCWDIEFLYLQKDLLKMTFSFQMTHDLMRSNPVQDIKEPNESR